jgi:hypothetical protein
MERGKRILDTMIRGCVGGGGVRRGNDFALSAPIEVTPRELCPAYTCRATEASPRRAGPPRNYSGL